MVIVAVPVASDMKMQELVGQMNSIRRKDDELFCLCHKAEVLEGVPGNSTEENKLRVKQAEIDEADANSMNSKLFLDTISKRKQNKDKDGRNSTSGHKLRCHKCSKVGHSPGEWR